MCACTKFYRAESISLWYLVVMFCFFPLSFSLLFLCCDCLAAAILYSWLLMSGEEFELLAGFSSL